MRFLALACCFALAALSNTADAKIHRSSSARQHFKYEHPCPATGRSTGKCPGYVIDHVVPLCAGGEDHPRNMQWQTQADAARKDVGERRQCRALKGRGT